MREIIFRGKRIDNGEWIEGYYCGKYNKTFFSPAEDSAQIIDEDLYWHEVIPETVSQFTGLTDKNGVKIWEGDIVNFVHKKWDIGIFPYKSPSEKTYTRNYAIEYVNTFNNYGLRFRNKSIHFPCKQSTLCMHDCEVIGNRWDNPELMGGTE